MPSAVLVCMLFVSTFWINFLSGAGRTGDAVVFVFSPLLNQRQTFLDASQLDVPIVDFGPLPFLVTVISNGPETLRKAYDAGARVALNSSAAALCANSTSPKSEE